GDLPHYLIPSFKDCTTLNMDNIHAFLARTVVEPLFPRTVKWVYFNIYETYSLRIAFPDISLTTNPRNPAKIAVCNTCKPIPSHRFYQPATYSAMHIRRTF